MSVLVAGIGNVFLRDDGFGVEVARRLMRRGGLPDEAAVLDVGIRGMHLAYRLLDGCAGLLLVDTVHRDGAPGTLYRLEHDLEGTGPGAGLDGHGMDPATVLATLDGLAAVHGIDRPVDRVLVLGCEPAELDEGMGLSEVVADAVEPALVAVDEMVALLLDDTVDAGPAAALP
ncbi:hydrogenase maturation protease [Streptomyces oceani]|uniref:hydrogenase maturation protease n=1 Tax=Streptomyces oceani TaxID=1075402 RepID=UPI0009A0F4D8|nr:hydrogenase maturation protease [Streptomyces oceani]